MDVDTGSGGANGGTKECATIEFGNTCGDDVSVVG